MYEQLDNYGKIGPKHEISEIEAQKVEKLLAISEQTNWYEPDPDNNNRETYRLHREYYTGITGEYKQDDKLIPVWYDGYSNDLRKKDDNYVKNKRKSNSELLATGNNEDYNKAVARLLENMCVTIFNDENWLGDNLLPNGEEFDQEESNLIKSMSFKTDDYDDFANGCDCLVVTEHKRGLNDELQTFAIDTTLNTKYESLCENKFWHLDAIKRNLEFGHINYFRRSDYTGNINDDKERFAGLTNVPRFIVSVNADDVISLAQQEYQTGYTAETEKQAYRIGCLVIFELYAQAYLMDRLIQTQLDHYPTIAADPNSPLCRSKKKMADLLIYFRNVIIRKERKIMRKEVGEKNTDNYSELEILQKALDEIEFDGKSIELLEAYVTQFMVMTNAKTYNYLHNNEGLLTKNPNNDQYSTSNEPINIIKCLEKHINMDTVATNVKKVVELKPRFVADNAHRPGDQYDITGVINTSLRTHNKKETPREQLLTQQAEKVTNNTKKDDTVAQTIVDGATRLIMRQEKRRKAALDKAKKIQEKKMADLDKAIEEIENLKKQYLKLHPETRVLEDKILEPIVLHHYHREDLLDVLN